jgi:hypothetical protein
MAVTSRERYAVVSCHVERPLDDRVWAAFSKLQAKRPGGFAVAALMRPPDTRAGEDELQWLERAREASTRGPFGHHTHWTAPDHARPTSGGTGERVLEEGRRLRELGLAPTLFCGGGWYTDERVAEACAELDYVDCTPRASLPAYLPEDAPWATLGEPARVSLPSGQQLLGLPTTHSLGDLARVVLRPQSRVPTLSPFVHVYFHDTDLEDARRRLLLRLVLIALARRAVPTDLDAYAGSFSAEAPEIAWNDVRRP